MEVFGKSPVVGSANVIYLSAILGRDGPIPGHKCDWKCENENVCGNMYRCKLTGLTHVCDKNCNQRILYDNHSSLCRASGRIFPLSPAEEQAVKGVRRKLDAESHPSESCTFKRRRRDAQFHSSPFERSFSANRGSGTLAGSGTQQLPTTGFRLDAGQSVRITSVPGWSGRIWGRTGCSFDTSGVGKCLTGDCGGRLECDGNGATPPASLFEITLGGSDNKDFYDVSLVDGYNLPMVALPTRGAVGACNATGCVADLNLGCPKELQVVGQEDEGGVVACKSACEAFGSDQYCCSGQFANPNTCRPSFYSTVFKRACPRAYSYAYDDGTSTFTCKASEYSIIFCPVANRIKRPSSQFPAPPAQGGNGQFMAPPAQGGNGQFMAPPAPNPATPTQNPSGQYMAPPTQGTAEPTQNQNPNGPYTAPPTQNTGTPSQGEDPKGQFMAPPTENIPAPTQGEYPNVGGGMGRAVEMQSSSEIARPVGFWLLLVLSFFASRLLGSME